jgi:hypothetical protein
LSTLNRLSNKGKFSSVSTESVNTSQLDSTLSVSSTQNNIGQLQLQEQEKEIMKKIALFISLFNLLISIYM